MHRAFAALGPSPFATFVEKEKRRSAPSHPVLELNPSMRSLEFSDLPRHMYDLLDTLAHSHRLSAPQP